MPPTHHQTERDHRRQAARNGMRQEWKATFYETDDTGERKTGTAAVAHTRYVTTHPLASPRVAGHAVFHALLRDPHVPEVHMTDYDIERTRLLTPEEDEQA